MRKQEDPRSTRRRARAQRGWTTLNRRALARPLAVELPDWVGEIDDMRLREFVCWAVRARTTAIEVGAPLDARANRLVEVGDELLRRVQTRRRDDAVACDYADAAERKYRRAFDRVVPSKTAAEQLRCGCAWRRGLVTYVRHGPLLIKECGRCGATWVWERREELP